MPEAALQPFVTSQRPTGVAGKVATCAIEPIWTWQAGPNAEIEAGSTTTSAAKPAPKQFGEQNKLGSYYCWNRIYEPSTGRWTTPDPAATPWEQLWSYCSSKPLNTTDPTALAELKMEWATLPTGFTNPDIRGDCGQRVAMIINFYITNHRPHQRRWVDYTIVQHVQKLPEVYKCDGSVASNTPSRYYEAWRVSNNGTIEGGGEDVFSTGTDYGGEGTKGELWIDGKARYLEVDFDDFILNNRFKQGSEPGGVVEAGDLYSSRVRPTWPTVYNSFGSGMIEHSLHVKWDCCCENHWVEATAYADVKNRDGTVATRAKTKPSTHRYGTGKVDSLGER